MKSDKNSRIYEARRLKLKELVDRFGTQKSFSEATGMNETVVSRMLYPEGKANKRNIGEQAVRQIEDALRLSRGWMDGIVEAEEKEFQKIDNSTYRIEVLDIQASAGRGVMIRDEFVETIKSIEYSENEAKSIFGGRPAENIKMIAVNGDSMSGTFEPRDQIFVDVSYDYFDGDGIYIFTIEDKLYIKRLQQQFQRIAVISDNKKYETWYIEKSDENKMQVLAKVLVSQSRSYKFHA